MFNNKLNSYTMYGILTITREIQFGREIYHLWILYFIETKKKAKLHSGIFSNI